MGNVNGCTADAADVEDSDVDDADAVPAPPEGALAAPDKPAAAGGVPALVVPALPNAPIGPADGIPSPAGPAAELRDDEEPLCSPLSALGENPCWICRIHQSRGFPSVSALEAGLSPLPDGARVLLEGPAVPFADAPEPSAPPPDGDAGSAHARRGA